MPATARKTAHALPKIRGVLGRPPSAVRVVQRQAGYRWVGPFVLPELCGRVRLGQSARHVHGRVEVLRPALPHLFVPFARKKEKRGLACGSGTGWGGKAGEQGMGTRAEQ